MIGRQADPPEYQLEFSSSLVYRSRAVRATSLVIIPKSARV